MRTTRSRSALGALVTAVLLVGATACSSGSGDTAVEPVDSIAETQGTGAAPTTVGGSEATSPETPATGTGGDDSSTDASTDASTDPPTTAALAVPAALQFSAPLVGGGTFDGAAVAGKPTVFWFWAPT